MLYRRESIVDALRGRGARVYIHPAPQSCSMAIVGSACETTPPPLPYIHESQLLQLHYWNQRFKIKLPWYQHFEPQQPSELIERQAEVAAVRNWLQKNRQQHTAGALLLSGQSGCGKKCLARAALRSAEMTVILDACAVCDASLKNSPDPEAISTLSARLPMCNGAVMIFNADRLCTADAKLLAQLIKTRRALFVFLISSECIDKKSAFWSNLAHLCTMKLQLKPLSKRAIVSVLQRVCELTQESLSESCLAKLAEFCEGDVRHALINLECKLRFSATSSSSYGQEYKENTQLLLCEVLSILTSKMRTENPQGGQPIIQPVPMSLRQFQIDRLDTDLQHLLESALHNTSSYKSLDDCVTMTHSLSDCDAFYHKSVTQDGDVSYRSTIPALTAGYALNHMRRAPRSLFSSDKQLKTRIRDALKKTSLDPRELCSAAVLSPESLCMDLLANRPELLAVSDNVSGWLLPPELLKTFNSALLE